MSVEAWLRGPIEGVDPLVAPSLYGFDQSREDLAKFTEGLTPEQIWLRPHGLGSVGFQLQHIAGSVDRLLTYLRGEQLTQEQIEEMKREMEPGPSLEELLAKVDAAFRRAEEEFRRVDPARLADPRGVGRKQLSTTVLGVMVHIAEHTQRHVGEVIITAKLVRALGEAGLTQAQNK